MNLLLCLEIPLQLWKLQGRLSQNKIDLYSTSLTLTHAEENGSYNDPRAFTLLLFSKY